MTPEMLYTEHCRQLLSAATATAQSVRAYKAPIYCVGSSYDELQARGSTAAVLPVGLAGKAQIFQRKNS